VALTLVGALGVIVLSSLPSSVGASVKTDCADDVSTVETAAAAYAIQHPQVAQLTIGALTAPGSGTLGSWPMSPSHQYVIVIAGDGNRLAGMKDSRGNTIEQNDIVVVTHGHIFDSTRSFAGSCALA